MKLIEIAEGYSVATQPDPDDMAGLAERGVKTLVCNRPDAENPPSHQAASIQDAAEAQGLAFVFNPVIGSAMTMENVQEQADAIDAADGPIVAYCASGTRSVVMWALAMAGRMPTAEILAATRRAGFALDHLAPQIEALAARTDG